MLFSHLIHLFCPDYWPHSLVFACLEICIVYQILCFIVEKLECIIFPIKVMIFVLERN